MSAESAAIPAATLILFRPRADGVAEHLMVERAAAMAFAGGALVFPGGRVDPADRALAATFPALDPDDAAARVAAVRETIEETGVAPAIEPEPDAATVAGWRARLAEGAPFARLLADDRARLLPERLVPFARWRPDLPDQRSFDTRFYIAEAPARSAPAADGGESVHALWQDAATLLVDADAGRYRLIFPTRRNLERLAALTGFADAVAHAGRHPVRVVTPRIEARAGADWLCIDEDLGYAVTAEPLAAVRRG